MYLALVAIHIVLALLLIFVILVQPGKGADVGAAFGGGGGSSLFGPRGPTSLLSRATTVVAVGFMITSVTLAWFSNKEILSNHDVLEEIERARQEKEKAAGAATPTEGAAPAEGSQQEIPVVPVTPAPTEPAAAPGGATPPAPVPPGGTPPIQAPSPDGSAPAEPAKP